MKYYTLESHRLFLKGIPYYTMSTIFETMTQQEVMTLLGHKKEEEYHKELEKHRLGYSSYNRRFVMFLLIDKASEKIIGRCGLHNWNEEHRRAEIGYVMHDETFRNQGLMSEAVGAVMDFGYRDLQLNRIDALVGEQNQASWRIIEKHGFVQEGILRQHVAKDQGYENSVLFSKLASEHKNEA